MKRSFLLAALTSAGVACANAQESNFLPEDASAEVFELFPEVGGETAPTGDADSGGKDAKADDNGGKCNPLESNSRPCGSCGKQTRYCSAAGTWNPWGTCEDEVEDAECKVGETRSGTCEKCGTSKDTCDPESCTWSTGSCINQGPCEAGDIEKVTASCSVVGEIRTRTCSDKCAWSAFSACALPTGWISISTSTLAGRNQHTAVWTGTEMLVWGGYGAVYPYAKGDGGSYSLSGDTWKTLPAAPSSFAGRYNHTAVWTGSSMIIYGGQDSSTGRNDIASYDPASQTWKSLTASTIAARYSHGAVWSTTTNEMIVWGGYGGTCSGYACADGAAFNPSTNTWTALPAPPPGFSGRYRHTMLWTGSEVVIWGGLGTSSSYLRDGARFDPKTKLWTKFADPPATIDGRYDHVSVFTGSEVLVWGGYGTYVSSSYGRSTGARYLPGGSWTAFSPPTDDVFATGTSAKRYAAQGWFGAGKLWLWGGTTGLYPYSALMGGAWYDPSLDKWGTMDVTDAPPARTRATVVWTGKEAIAWGGSSTSSGGTYFNDGAIHRP